MRIETACIGSHIPVVDSWPNDWAASPVSDGEHVSDLSPNSTIRDADGGPSLVKSHVHTEGRIMNTGVVNNQKGFGFIQPEEGSKHVFVHIGAVERAGMGTLNEGQKVSFDDSPRPRICAPPELPHRLIPKKLLSDPIADWLSTGIMGHTMSHAALTTDVLASGWFIGGGCGSAVRCAGFSI